MAARHGTANRYNQGCRCEDCKDSHRLRAAAYRQRRVAGETRSPVANVSPLAAGAPQSGPGPVEVGVGAELSDLADARPGLAQIALALARLMDNPRAVNQQPAAAKALVTLLDKLLRSASAQGRRGGLALVRAMAEKGDA